MNYSPVIIGEYNCVMSRTFRKKSPIYQGLGKSWDTSQDKKKWYKPSKAFKKTEKQKRRAQEHQALQTEKEIPRFKKTDQWNWS